MIYMSLILLWLKNGRRLDRVSLRLPMKVRLFERNTGEVHQNGTFRFYLNEANKAPVSPINRNVSLNL